MHSRLVWPCALAAAALVACHNDETPPAQGDGSVRAVSPVVMGGSTFRLPLDAALSPDGKTAYFTALADDGAALFKAPVRGAMSTKLADLIAPLGVEVSPDGNSVLVADAAVESNDGALGAIVSVPSGGGSPSPLSGTVGTLPRAIGISGDRVVFSGVDPADGVSGIFQVGANGGALTTVQKWGLIDPTGVAVASTGEVYALDAESEGSATRRLVKVAGGNVTVLTQGLRVGFPAGIALAQNERVLLVASTDPATGKNRFERFALTGASAGAPANTAVANFSEPAGLHRAQRADTYAFVDSGANDTGTVFVVNPL
jgi:DNA-binding beta-propeller fold protein YncE